MARGVNKVILIGNLGQDPETRYLPSGGAVANTTLATTEAWKDKQTGQTQERTEWHRLVFYNRLAEVVRDYLRKGSKVYVEGSIRSNKWQDKTGQERTTVQIIVNEMQMLDSKNAGMGMSSAGGSSFSRQSALPEMAMHEGSNAPSFSGEGQAFPEPNDFDDEVPF